MLEANKRLDDNGNKEAVSYDSVMKHLGISEAELWKRRMQISNDMEY